MEGRYSDWQLRLEKVSGLASDIVGKDIPSLRELPHRDDPRREASYRQALEINQAHADRPLLCEGAPGKLDIPWKLRRVVVPPIRANPMRRANNMPNTRDPRRAKINERAGYEPWEIGPPCLVENELVPAEDETCSLLVVDSADWPDSKHCFVDVVAHECNVQRAAVEAGDGESLFDLDEDSELEVIAHPGYSSDLLEDRPMLEDDQPATQPLAPPNERTRRISDDGVERVKTERLPTHKPVPRINETDVALVDLCSDDEGPAVKKEPLAPANRKPRVSDAEPEIVWLSDDDEDVALDESPDCSEIQQVDREEPSLAADTRKGKGLAEAIATSRLRDSDAAEVTRVQQPSDAGPALRGVENRDEVLFMSVKDRQGIQVAESNAQRRGGSEPIVREEPREKSTRNGHAEPEILLLSDDEDEQEPAAIVESLRPSEEDRAVSPVLGSTKKAQQQRKRRRENNEAQPLAEAIAKSLQDSGAEEDMQTQQLIDEETALRIAIRVDELDDMQLEEALARSLEDFVGDARDSREESEQIAATDNERAQSTRREPDTSDVNNKTFEESELGEADNGEEVAPTTNESVSSVDVHQERLTLSVEDSVGMAAAVIELQASCVSPSSPEPNSENCTEPTGGIGKQTDERSGSASPDGHEPIEDNRKKIQMIIADSPLADNESRQSSLCSPRQSCCSEDFSLFFDDDSAGSECGNAMPEELATDSNCQAEANDEPLVDRVAGVTVISTDREDKAHEHARAANDSPPRVDKCETSDFALAHTREALGDNKENVCARETEKNNDESSCSQQRPVTGALRTNNRDECFKRKATPAPQKELRRTHRKRKRRRNRRKPPPDNVIRKFNQLAVRVDDIFPNDEPVHGDNLDAPQSAKIFCVSQEPRDYCGISAKNSGLVISGAFNERLTSLRPFKRKLNEESVVDTFKRPKREFTLLIKDDQQTSISFTFSVLARYYEYAQRTFNSALFFYKHYGAAVSFNFLRQAITANEAFWNRRLANWNQDECRVYIDDVTESQTCDISKDEIPSVDLNCNSLDSPLQYTDDLNSKCAVIEEAASQNDLPAKRFRSSSLDHVKLKFLRDPMNKDSWKILNKQTNQNIDAVTLENKSGFKKLTMDKKQDLQLKIPPSFYVDKSVPELEPEYLADYPVVNMQYSRKLENCLGDSLKKKLKKRSISFTETADEVDKESKKKRLTNTKDSTKEKSIISNELYDAYSRKTERKTQQLADSPPNSFSNSCSDLIINNSSDGDSGQCSTINELIITEDNVPDTERYTKESTGAHNSNIQKENESCDITSDCGSEISKVESIRNEHINSSDTSRVERKLREKLRMHFGEDSDEEFIEQELNKLIYLKHRRKKISKIPECHADNSLKENSNFQLGFSSNSRELTDIFKVSIKCKQNELITATSDVDNKIKETMDESAVDDTIPSSNDGNEGNKNQVISIEPELEEGDFLYNIHTSKSDVEDDYYIDSDNEQSSSVTHDAKITSQPTNPSDEDDDITFIESYPNIKKEFHRRIKREDAPETEIITLDSDDENASLDRQHSSGEDQNIHVNENQIETPKSPESETKNPDTDNLKEHDGRSGYKVTEKKSFKDLEDLILASCGVEEESSLSNENDVEQFTKSHETDTNESAADISTLLNNNNHSEHEVVVEETMKVTGNIGVDLKNSKLLEHFNLTMETSAPENSSENGLFDQIIDEEQQIVSEKLEALTRELVEKTEQELSSTVNYTSKSLKVRNIDELLRNPQKCSVPYLAAPASSLVTSCSCCPPQQNLNSISALRLPNQQPTPITNSVEGKISSVNLSFQSSIHQSQSNGHVRFEKASKLYGHLYEKLSDIFEMNSNGDLVKRLYNEMNTLLSQLGQLSEAQVCAYYNTFHFYGTLTEEIFEKFHFKLITVQRCLLSLYTYAKDKDFNNFMQKMKRGTESGYLSDISNVYKLYEKLKSEGFISELADNTSPHFLSPVPNSSIAEILKCQKSIYYNIICKDSQLKFQQISQVPMNNSRNSWTEMVNRFKTIEETMCAPNANMIWNQLSTNLSSNMNPTSTVNNQSNNSIEIPALTSNGNAALDKSSSTSMTGANVVHYNTRVPEKTLSTSEATVMEKNQTSQSSLSSCTPLLSGASTTNNENNRVLDVIPSTSKTHTENEKVQDVGSASNSTTSATTSSIVKTENDTRTETSSSQVKIKEETLDKPSAHCYKCQKLSTIVCADCENVAYCSSQCQHSHWKEHFISCRKSS